jgi:putative redox protein
VNLAGRPFTIRRQFVDDLDAYRLTERIATIDKAVLILHSPVDNLVGIQHAARLFTAARHPKSYVSLDHADHLLTDRRDAAYAARVVATWAERYVDDESGRAVSPRARAQAVVAETTQGRFLNDVVIGEHQLLVDEPAPFGGLGAGPSPDDLLAAALGACISMTLRFYADRKAIPLARVTVEVDHTRVGAANNERPGGSRAPEVDTFDCRILLEGAIEDADRDRLLAIAKRCPVHRILGASSTITTMLVQGVEPRARRTPGRPGSSRSPRSPATGDAS